MCALRAVKQIPDETSEPKLDRRGRPKGSKAQLSTDMRLQMVRWIAECYPYREVAAKMNKRYPGLSVGVKHVEYMLNSKKWRPVIDRYRKRLDNRMRYAVPIASKTKRLEEAQDIVTTAKFEGDHQSRLSALKFAREEVGDAIPEKATIQNTLSIGQVVNLPLEDLRETVEHLMSATQRLLRDVTPAERPSAINADILREIETERPAL